MKFCSELMSPCQMKKMSSMKRFQIIMLFEKLVVRAVSMDVMNMLAYGGAILVPIAVPSVCR